MLAKCGRSLYGLALITPSEFVVRLLRDIPSATSAIRPPRASICLYLDCQSLASVAVLPLGKFCASALTPSLEWRYFDFDWHRSAGLARGYNTIKCRASKREGFTALGIQLACSAHLSASPLPLGHHILTIKLNASNLDWIPFLEPLWTSQTPTSSKARLT